MTLLEKDFSELDFISFEDNVEELLEGESISYWLAVSIDETEYQAFPMDRKVSIAEKGNYKDLQKLIKALTEDDFMWEDKSFTLFLVSAKKDKNYSDLAIFRASYTGLSRAVPGCFLDTYPSRFKVPSYLLEKVLSFSKTYQEGLPAKTQDFIKELISEPEVSDLNYLVEEYNLLLNDRERELVATLWAVAYPLIAERASSNKPGLLDNQDTPFRDGFYYLRGQGTYEPFMSAKRLKEFHRSAFGSYRKDLAKVTEHLPSLSLQKLSSLSGLVSLDYLTKEIERMGDSLSLSDDYISSEKYKTIPEGIPEKAKKLIFSYLTGNSQEAEEEITNWLPVDVVDMLIATPHPSPSLVKDIKNSRTLTELHEVLASTSLDFRATYSLPEAEKISALEERVFLQEVKPYSKLAELVSSIEGKDDVTGEVFSLRLLENYSDFVYAGRCLNNCIDKASYYSKFLKGTSLVFTIEDSYRELLGAIELSTTRSPGKIWEVTQVYGYKNEKLPFEDSLKEALNQALEIFYEELPEAQEYLKKKSLKETEQKNYIDEILERVSGNKQEESSSSREQVLEALSEFFLIDDSRKDSLIANRLLPDMRYNDTTIAVDEPVEMVGRAS